MNLSQLRYFKVVAEHGKIISAAEDLYISSPALSASIASLERELGVQLFDRMSNRIILNEQGQLFLHCVERIFDDLDSTKQEIQRSLQSSIRTLHIAVTTSAVWVPLVSSFVSSYPQIKLSCSTVDIPELRRTLSSPNFSFILAEKDDLPNTNMECIPLFDEHPMVVLPVSNPLAAREVIHPSDLTGQTLYLPTDKQSMNIRVKKMLFASNHISSHLCECSDSIAKGMLLEGQGIAFCTDHYTNLQDARLCYRPFAAPNCRWTQCLFWNSAFPFSPEEEAFKNHVQSLYASYGQPPVEMN